MFRNGSSDVPCAIVVICEWNSPASHLSAREYTGNSERSRDHVVLKFRIEAQLRRQNDCWRDQALSIFEQLVRADDQMVRLTPSMASECWKPQIMATRIAVSPDVSQEIAASECFILTQIVVEAIEGRCSWCSRSSANTERQCRHAQASQIKAACPDDKQLSKRNAM